MERCSGSNTGAGDRLLDMNKWRFLYCWIFFISCYNPTKSDILSFKEIKRISSPDLRVEAVLVEANGGATVSTINKIYLLEKGAKIDLNTEPVFLSDHQIGVDIAWKENKNLFINYEKARIFKFTNFWNPSLDNWNYVVEISLHCLSSKGQLREEDKQPMKQFSSP